MFEDLRRLFADSWNAFLTEAGRREPEDRVAELLTAMRREMVAARANLPLQDRHLQGAQADLERERRALADAERRGQLAERIGDQETVRVAAEFADRHRKRVAVMEEKLRAAQAERDLAYQESDEMMRRYKEADTHRFALVAEIRRRGAHARLDSAMGRDPGDAADELRRAEERIIDETAYAEALDDLGAGGASPPPPQPDVDDRLAELKRRMGM
jgi:phage shock protein A